MQADLGREKIKLCLQNIVYVENLYLPSYVITLGSNRKREVK